MDLEEPMSKIAVVFYSKSGSNRYLAERTAEALKGELIGIKPRVSPLAFQLLASSTGLSLGNRRMKRDISLYDSVVLCGPIWMGQLIAPLRDFIGKYGSAIKKLHFITCCGSTDSSKDDKFGYAHVLRKVETEMPEKVGIMEAFPIELVLPRDKKNDDQAMMNTRLNDSNFIGEIKERFDSLISRITAS